LIRRRPRWSTILSKSAAPPVQRSCEDSPSPVCNKTKRLGQVYNLRNGPAPNVTGLKLEAEKRLGEMIAEQKRTVGLAKGTAGQGRPKIGTPQPEAPKSNLPTLASQGIDHKLSARSQKLAALWDEEFAALVAAADAEPIATGK
jgi:hypothetical protein